MEELRQRALSLQVEGVPEAAAAGQAARLVPLNDDAQELFLRALVAAGHAGSASVHLASCEATFTREHLHQDLTSVRSRFVDSRHPKHRQVL